MARSIEGSLPNKRIAEKWRRPSEADDIKICTICDRNLVNGRTLPCLHSFCEECLLILLQTYQNHRKLDRTFACPTCKVLVPCHILGPVSAKWLTMFPLKSDVDKTKEAILVVEEMCSACSLTWKITPASRFCVNCQEYFCFTCEADHIADPNNKKHATVGYIVKEMKTTPASNISKFPCKLHSSHRYAYYCEVHNTFLCNTCKEENSHRHCRVVDNIIKTTGKINKAESKLNVLNCLKRDERNKGKQLFRLIEQIDGIQGRLQKFRVSQERRFCNYVMQATMTEQKTDQNALQAIDALKGKLEFVKTNGTHEAVFGTMTRVENLLTAYTNIFSDEDIKPVKAEIHKNIAELEKILSKPIFDILDVSTTENNNSTSTVLSGDMKLEDLKPSIHICKKRVDDSLDEGTVHRVGSQMKSVGALCYGNMFATAFRVGSKYVITAAHTVRDIVDSDRTGNSDWSALEGKMVYISFESPPNPDGATFSINHHVTFLHDAMNIAILELTTREKLPPPLVLPTKARPADMNHVHLIGYGHVGSKEKHLDIKCPIVAPDSERAKQAYDWLKWEERQHRCNLLTKKKSTAGIRWNYAEMRQEGHIAIDCCMEYRALGSPVLVDTESGADVVAMVTHSVPDCFSELSKKVQEAGREFRFEVATTMSKLYEVLIVETRVVADDIFVKDKKYF